VRQDELLHHVVDLPVLIGAPLRNCEWL
jgi:hypothetical protein